MATDIATFPAPPSASPLAPTDLLFVGRPPTQGAPTGTASAAYSVQLAQMAAALLPMATPPVLVTALGSDQPTAAILTAQAANIITGGNAGSGVRLPPGASQTIPALNSLTIPMLLYPPLVLNGAGTAYVATSINGQTQGAPVTIPPSVEVTARTVDGFNWFVG